MDLLENISLQEKKIKKIRKIIINWEKLNYESFPWRETGNSFHALIAEMMLQRTKAEQVLSVYIDFTVRYHNLREASQADKNEIRELFQPLGLRWRTEKIIELIELLSTDNLIPQSYNELVKLPGVGDYIASAYLSIHKNECKSIIDSNAVRLWGRVLGIKTNSETRRKKYFKNIIGRITPQKECRIFNLGVLDLSMKVCKKQPLHNFCPLNRICEYYKAMKSKDS